MQTTPVLFLLSLPAIVFGRCSIPQRFHGEWFNQRYVPGMTFLVTADKWDIIEDGSELNCEDISSQGNSATMLMVKSGISTLNTCYMCVEVLWKTPNILKYREGNCFSSLQEIMDSPIDFCSSMNPSDYIYSYTMFRQSLITVSCATTFEGAYQFSYLEDLGFGGFCNHPDSQIKACQDPGSAYIDNEVFYMTYRECLDEPMSRNASKRYRCMGSWSEIKDGLNYTYAAIADTAAKSAEEKFKCLMTLTKDKENIETRWVMSTRAECGTLSSIYTGPVKLVLTKIPIYSSDEYNTPRCSFDKDIVGDWFIKRVRITIDDKMHFPRALNQKDFYLSCQQTNGTRYLLSQTTVGKCDVNYVCMDIEPRNERFLNLKVGVPFQVGLREFEDPDAYELLFRANCENLTDTSGILLDKYPNSF